MKRNSEVRAARKVYEQAHAVHADAQRHADEALLLARQAYQRLTEAEQRQNAQVVLAQLEREQADSLAGVDPGLGKRVILATPGCRVWLMPNGDGLGQVGTSLGMTGPTDRHLVIIKAEDHDQSYNWLRLYPSVVLTLAEARERWWVLDAGGSNLVSGGHRDHDRTNMLAYSRTIQDGELRTVQQGSEFIKETS